MYPDSVSLRHFRGMVDCLVEQIHVVIVERRRDFVKLFYCVDIQHFILCIPVKFRMLWEFVPKTIAKIAKKSVISQIVELIHKQTT